MIVACNERERDGGAICVSCAVCNASESRRLAAQLTIKDEASVELR